MGEVNHDTALIWEGWQLRQFRAARCVDCRAWLDGPRALCPQCWSERIEYMVVEGAGHVLSWSLPRPATPDAAPVITALVSLDDADGVHVLAQLVGCAPADMRFDLPVVIDWREEGGRTFPQFRPAGVTS